VGAGLGHQRRLDFIIIGGFAQVIHRPGLNRGHCAGDVSVPSQNDDAHIRAFFAKGRHNIKAIAVQQAQVDDGEGQGRFGHYFQGLGYASTKTSRRVMP
jgi:hypothetical protein